MDLFPAIDIRSGRVVRLSQGEAARQTVYEADPAAVAERFAALGARWIHVVDLDRAFGEGENEAVVRGIIERVRGRVRVQLGGGFRSLELLKRGVEMGADRVVVGTAAATDPSFLGAAAGGRAAGAARGRHRRPRRPGRGPGMDRDLDRSRAADLAGRAPRGRHRDVDLHRRDVGTACCRARRRRRRGAPARRRAGHRQRRRLVAGRPPPARGRRARRRHRGARAVRRAGRSAAGARGRGRDCAVR